MAASVVLIDDDDRFSESLTASFEANGIEIDHASTWEAGLGLFRVGLHELVIADYNLPGSKHGLLLLLEAKRLRPSSELILISGAVTPTGSDLIAASGIVDRFIPKTADLASELLKAGRLAVVRAGESTDWPALARAYALKTQINEATLSQVDDALRTQVTR